MKLYKERGFNPASGCLPALLQLVLLLPMYQVFSQGLSAPDISSMLQVFGHQVITSTCQTRATQRPCINPIIPWLFNLDAHQPQILFADLRASASARWRSSPRCCSWSRRG